MVDVSLREVVDLFFRVPKFSDGASSHNLTDELLRKHLPRMLSLIKNEIWEIEHNQISL